jgi:hypothetical protein
MDFPWVIGFDGGCDFQYDFFPRKLFLGCLEKLSFCPISALFKKFYPRNINYMPAVNFFSRLDLEQKS